jgi:hypothetical protein
LKNIQKSTIEKSGNKEKSKKIPRLTTKLTKTRCRVGSEASSKQNTKKVESKDMENTSKQRNRPLSRPSPYHESVVKDVVTKTLPTDKKSDKKNSIEKVTTLTKVKTIGKTKVSNQPSTKVSSGSSMRKVKIKAIRNTPGTQDRPSSIPKPVPQDVKKKVVDKTLSKSKKSDKEKDIKKSSTLTRGN